MCQGLQSISRRSWRSSPRAAWTVHSEQQLTSCPNIAIGCKKPGDALLGLPRATDPDTLSENLGPGYLGNHTIS